jgi:signal transduction histidine kinase
VAARRDAASIILGATIVLQYSFSQRSNILADVDAQYHFDALAALHGALQKDAQREAAALAQAEAVLQTKVTYVRRLSHEVRTPLQVIYSGLQLILSRKRAEVSHGVLGVLEEMRQSCLDGMGILDDLLSYERLDAGTMTLEREALPVTELVRQSMRDFSVHAELSDVRLEYSDPFGENRRNRPLVNADRRKMTQVLRNMLSNALRFSPAGSCIRVRVLCVTRRKELLARIEVADSGPGLTPEMRERLVKDAGRFDHTELLESEQGHGMGLWLLRGIVEMHSGQVGVESEGAGKGSTFFVELPVLASPTSQPFSGSVDSSDQNTLFRSYPITPHPRRAGLEQPLRFSFSSSASSENSAEEEELAASRPLRILIVDDSVLCRKMVSRLLKEEGCLDEAADGVEALRSVLRSMQDEAPYHM